MTYIKKLVMHGFKSFANKTEINFDKGINVVIGPNGSGKSCSYDTIVTLANGEEIEIGKLIEEQIKNSNQIKELDDGVYVDGNDNFNIVSLNKATMKSEVKRISKFIRRKGDDLYSIKTRSGRELKATKCHPIMSFSNGEVKSKIINELDKGSFIAVPRVINIDSVKEDIGLSRLMGYIIGDGYIASDRIEFVNKDPEVLEDYEKLIMQYSQWGIRKRHDKNITRIYCRDKTFYSKLRSLYGLNKKTITSAEKNIPNYFLALGKKSVSNLLAGLFDTDGSVRKNPGIIEYCTKNRNLARQVQSLLLRFGINSKIKRRLACASNTKEKIKREYYYLYIYGIENLRKFYENIPLRVSYKSANIKYNLDKNKIPNNNVDLLPQEINFKIKEIINLLGISYKPLRKQYPALAAYIENRCAPSRQGVNNILPILNQKFALLHEKYNSLQLNQNNLIEFLDLLNVSAPVAAQAIGLHKTIIRNQWAAGEFNATSENLVKFKTYLSVAFLTRIQKTSEIMTLLYNISNSDIYWDQIISIEKLNKPDFVYDLTVEDNHNFIANNIFAHNSNISDALCFVLGRLSSKSIRAAKAKNLLFMGSKYAKPAREANVDLVFDNANRTFSIDKDEIVLSRTVKHSGSSVYRINDEVKNRSDVVELLAQAGIDSHGFNLVLQGQIQAVVRMHPEDRRKVVEEVAGISIYETRKEKSLHELEKTDEKLREINAILRERTAFLRNLENERQQALKFKEMENTVKRCKASLIQKKIEEKEHEIASVIKSIEQKTLERDKLKSKAEEMQKQTTSHNERIIQINKHIQHATGVEQDTLHGQIANLRAELAGLKVRKENLENRKSEIENRTSQILEQQIPEYEKELAELRKESPLVAKKQSELAKKKQELAILEEEKKKSYSMRNDVISIKERIKEKEHELTRLSLESDAVLKKIEEQSSLIKSQDLVSCKKRISEINSEISKKKDSIKSLSNQELDHAKVISSAETEIRNAEKIKTQVSSLDTCPLCQSNITSNHKDHVNKEANQVMDKFQEVLNQASHSLEESKKNKSVLEKNIEMLEISLFELEKELNKHYIINDKKELLSQYLNREKLIQKEVQSLVERRDNFQQKNLDTSHIEERYFSVLKEIEEISARTEQDIDQTLLYKERELEKMKDLVKLGQRDLESLSGDITDFESSIESKTSLLNKKDAEEAELTEKFNKLFSERDALQEKIQKESYDISTLQGEWRQVDEQINYLKVGDAKFSAEKEAYEMERSEFVGVELIKAPTHVLEEKLEKTRSSLQSIGSINLRALEIYDEIKAEYERVQVKVTTLQTEKEDIMQIIQEIDQKKRRSFMKTFNQINEFFSSNFSRLSTKGQAFLELENPEDLFSGGVRIVIRLGRGKFFDVTSLSGGEQTLIALSLLFAIQEFKPYHFYIFDEIDAALDKRNSERLSALLKQYMKSGQYIAITHNDAIIMDSSILYGVSMHEGISKILSLKVGDALQKEISERIEQETQSNAENQVKETPQNLDESSTPSSL